jgi:hypothetical protein
MLTADFSSDTVADLFAGKQMLHEIVSSSLYKTLICDRAI